MPPFIKYVKKSLGNFKRAHQSSLYFPLPAALYHCALDDVCEVGNKQQRYTRKKRINEKKLKRREKERNCTGSLQEDRLVDNISAFAEAKLRLVISYNVQDHLPSNYRINIIHFLRVVFHILNCIDSFFNS